MKCWLGSETCTALQNGGTALPTGAVETWTGGNGVSATGLNAATVKEVTWWQPKETSDYESALRRYSKGDRVKAYNLSLQDSATVAATVVTNTMFTAHSVVILVGASALTTGAIAFGAASLAF